MGLNRPTFKVNVAANKKATEKQSIFYDLAPNTTTRVRILPPTNESGVLFTVVANHFKLKAPEGYGMALACLCEHGNPEVGEDCYLCNLVKFLEKGDKSDKKIADDLEMSKRWYIQVLVYDKVEEGYIGPKFIGLSRTTADKVQDILNSQDDVGDDFFCDPDAGQDITLSRVGSGMQSRYSVAPTGKKAKLDDTFPDWESKIIIDQLDAMDLKVYDTDEQKKAVYRTFDDELDWEAIQEAIG